MNKQLYIFTEGKPNRTTIRNYGHEDFESLIGVQRLSFPPPFPEELLWNKEQLAEHVDRFPGGALCAEADGRIIASMTGLIVHMDSYGHIHDWATITDDGYIRNHNPNGDTLYVVDLCVIPEYRKSGIGKWLMQSMYETVVELGLARLLGGGRMPGFAAKAHEATPEQYLERVIRGEWNDPVISFLLRCGRMPVGVAHRYLEDEQSHNCAAIMEWRNPFHI
ncbi:GNAT family N-acetyltransferase [Paenibacillus harenae]|uniref:GNAT family N-acetyltransferase n=1 Tax=Paenibacillus harenae TaxID=306543 RepID=UPI00278D5B46|nr:GNAT family N-acetyltransferase [Paenibacillus harenae]MDQ0058011.1 GNAT superfamily N-acetyltransferase [Paenibacillus harenae]